MPRLARRAAKPRRKIARRGRKANPSRPIRSIPGKGQYATCVETHDFGPIVTNAGALATFTLSQFPRAQQMAGLFSYYKAVKVTWSYEPLYNTFQESNTLAVGKPYILTMMNRSQEVVNTNYNSLLGAGARPVPFTNKYLLTYKPNWCVPGLPAITANFSTGDITNFRVTGLKPVYDWIGTPPSVTGSNAENTAVTINDTALNAVGPVITNQVTYNGHAQHFFQDGALNQPIGRLICQVEWLFKGAKSNVSGV